MTGEAIDWRTPADELVAKEEGSEAEAMFWRGPVLRNIEVMATFCGEHPSAWATLKAWMRAPCASYAELGESLGIGRSAVCKHLHEAAAELPMLRPLLRRRK